MTFGVYIGFGGLIDGCSALGVVYEFVCLFVGV